MKVKALLLAALTGAIALILPACVVTGSVHEREYHPRPYVVEGPPAGYVVVRERPPEVVFTPSPPPPRGDVVWVPGYYMEDRGRWVLVQGHYEARPRPGAVWVAPRYERAGAEIRFYSGGWH